MFGLTFLDVNDTATAATTITTFVTSLIDKVKATITLTDLATIVGLILASTLVIYFAWVYGRKGLKAIIDALKGRQPKA